LYFIIFREEWPNFIDHARKVIGFIGNWYIEEDFTYIRIFGATATPYHFPKYVPNKLVVGEIAHHMILQGFNASLFKEMKKNNFIPYGFRLRHYFIKDLKHARKEAPSHLEYHRTIRKASSQGVGFQKS
jgi:hypothetical protein